VENPKKVGDYNTGFYNKVLNICHSEYSKIEPITKEVCPQYYAWLKETYEIEVESSDFDGANCISALEVSEQIYMLHLSKFK